MEKLEKCSFTLLLTLGMAMLMIWVGRARIGSRARRSLTEIEAHTGRLLQMFLFSQNHVSFKYESSLKLIWVLLPPLESKEKKCIPCLINIWLACHCALALIDGLFIFFQSFQNIWTHFLQVIQIYTSIRCEANIQALSLTLLFNAYKQKSSHTIQITFNMTSQILCPHKIYTLLFFLFWNSDFLPLIYKM